MTDAAASVADVVRVRVGDVVRSGRAITLPDRVDPASVVEAIRSPDDADDTDSRIAVDASEPGPVHEHVGYVHPGMGLRTRTALARAARSRGVTTPDDEEAESIRERLTAIDVGEGDIADHRRAVAEVTTETERLREQVAAARGKLQAAREGGGDATAATAELESAVRHLSEIETDSVAASQRLKRAREAARERRDRRERLRRLEDRAANLEREARAHLVGQLADRYREAIAAVPSAGNVADPFDADPVTAALAIARLAALSAPVVLACDRFGSAAAARRWLDAPVVRV